MVDDADAALHATDNGYRGIRVLAKVTENFADREDLYPVVRFSLSERRDGEDCYCDGRNEPDRDPILPIFYIRWRRLRLQ